MHKKSEIITVVLFCIVVASVSVLFVALPDKTFSQQENRNLAVFPELNKETFFSGEFGEQLNVYFADQFPFRDLMVNLRAMTEQLLLKGTNNGVLYDYNQLAVYEFNSYHSFLEITPDTDRLYLDTIQIQLDALDRLGQSLSVPLVTVIPPRTIDVTDSIYSYNRPDGDTAFNMMEQTLSKNAGYIDALSLLRKKYQDGEYVIYRTDHHWTTLGAYYIYCEIMKELGRGDKIIPIEEFDITQIQDFSGTTAAKGNFPFYEPDILELWRLRDEGEYEILIDGEQFDGFYSEGFLQGSDKYSVFLDGTHNVTSIKKIGQERETLVIAKDSFANCLIPFLAREYDIIALNLRSNTTLSFAAEYYSASAVLVVYNMENIMTSADLANVK